MTATAYPLQWPAGRPRTPAHRRERARFGTRAQGAAKGAAIAELTSELRRLGVRGGPVISTNLPLRNDGLPRAASSEPDDPGVAVYFTLDGNQVAMACDRWTRVADNLRAVALCIDAIRGLERWGAKDMVRAAFTGFKALPENAGGRAWWTVLGLDLGIEDSIQVEKITAADVDAAYKRKARTLHPDAGGAPGDWHELQEARRQALQVAL